MASRVRVFLPVEDDSTTPGPATALRAPGGRISELELDTKRLADEVASLLRCIEQIEPSPSGRYEIAEVQFNLGFNAKGKVGILGGGVEAGAQAAIKVTIKRSEEGKATARVE